MDENSLEPAWPLEGDEDKDVWAAWRRLTGGPFVSAFVLRKEEKPGGTLYLMTSGWAVYAAFLPGGDWIKKPRDESPPVLVWGSRDYQVNERDFAGAMLPWRTTKTVRTVQTDVPKDMPFELYNLLVAAFVNWPGQKHDGLVGLADWLHEFVPGRRKPAGEQVEEAVKAERERFKALVQMFTIHGYPLTDPGEAVLLMNAGLYGHAPDTLRDALLEHQRERDEGAVVYGDDPDPPQEPADIERPDVAEQVRQYQSGLQRLLAAEGMTVSPLDAANPPLSESVSGGYYRPNTWGRDWPNPPNPTALDRTRAVYGGGY